MIDFHVHVYPPEIIRDAEKIAQREPYFDALTHNNVHKWGTTDDLLVNMDNEDIGRAVIFGFAFRDIGLCRLCNDYVIESIRRHPDRLSGMCIVPPTARGAFAEIERCADSGIIGVGELFPEGQNIDITDRDQTWRLAAALHEMNLCVLWHTAEPVGHNYAGKGNVGPREAAAFCFHHPEVKTIFAHLGGGLWLYEQMPEMKLYLSNAHYDLAALPWLYDADILNVIKSAGVSDKFLMGTDFPILGRARYDKYFEKAGLEADDTERIMYRNAESLLYGLGRAGRDSAGCNR